MISEPASREVQSVHTAFRIVGLLQDLDGAKMNELADHLDLAKSTVHNYLGTLQQLGYVVERDGNYRLGLRFLTHGMAARHGLALGDPVRQALPDLARELSQPVWWVAEEQGRGLFVERSAPGDGEPIYGRVGKRSYLHTHAPGKAILARWPTDAVRDLVDHEGLPVQTRETVTDVEAFLATLETVRERGYATSSGEAALGIRSIGVGFDGPMGGFHALGVFGLTHEFGGNTEERVSGVLRDAAAAIEERVGAEGA